MKFLEKDLEEIIFEANNDELEKKGLPINGKIFRQLRIGNYGISDLITFERYHEEYIDYHFDNEKGIVYEAKLKSVLYITVYELKKEVISVSAFIQAVKYVKGIKRYLEKRNFYHEVKYNIVLIGKNINPNSDFIFLPDVISRDAVTFFTYKYGIDGLEFKRIRFYKLTNEGFGYEN